MTTNGESRVNTAAHAVSDEHVLANRRLLA